MIHHVLDRQFRPTTINAAWVSDIAYAGWLYPAAVMDLYSRKIVGWAMAPSTHAELVCSALKMAITRHQARAGLIVHSDRGSQYTSATHREPLSRHGLLVSMSRKGNCRDNAVMERFFLNLKMDRVWQQDYANHAEASRNVTDDIVGFYNTVHLHSTLGYMVPSAYERNDAAKQLIEASEKT